MNQQTKLQVTIGHKVSRCLETPETALDHQSKITKSYKKRKTTRSLQKTRRTPETTWRGKKVRRSPSIRKRGIKLVERPASQGL